MTETLPEGALRTHQTRSAETARRIALALETLLKQKPFEKITMAELATEAGLTPGAIYRRFKNKQALLPGIFLRYREELELWGSRVTAEAVLKEADNLRDSLEILVRETLACFRANAHIFRTVHLYARVHPELKHIKSDETQNENFDPIDGLLRAFKKEVAHQPQIASRLIGHTLLSSCIERALYTEHSPATGLCIDDRQFSALMADMFSCWLKG